MKGSRQTDRRDSAFRWKASFRMCPEWVVLNSLLNVLRWAGLRHSKQEQTLSNATFFGTVMCGSSHSTDALYCMDLSFCFSVFRSFSLFSPQVHKITLGYYTIIISKYTASFIYFCI